MIVSVIIRNQYRKFGWLFGGSSILPFFPYKKYSSIRLYLKEEVNYKHINRLFFLAINMWLNLEWEKYHWNMKHCPWRLHLHIPSINDIKCNEDDETTIFGIKKMQNNCPLLIMLVVFWNNLVKYIEQH